ncbi:MAG TPA: NAD(+)/NADH kinase [Terriglobales bacterium]|nr:NAD(+)/NADH kinase [Terriglobales bacterium]
MPTVAIVTKPNKPEITEIISGVIEWLEKHGYDVVLDPASAAYTHGHREVEREQLYKYKPEFVVVLGGDGTLLAAARAVAHAGIPLLAVNLGSLGFLTEVTLSELDRHLTSITEHHCKIDERTMLTCRLSRHGKRVCEHEALNDVVIKASAARLADFLLCIDGHRVADYKADALIVATPTGSTAYSLAAGGPILAPSVNAFVITPVSPHALTHRPLVVEDSSQLSITVGPGEDSAFLAMDGQVNVPLEDGDLVECVLAKDRVKLIRAENGYRFFDILRNKLHWGER